MRTYLLIVFVLLQVSFIYSRKPIKFNETQHAAKFDNPNYVRDRLKKDINKPQFPDTWTNRFKKPYHPAWMDYCDPYHCNDYHKAACGVNRKTRRFKWFQSGCHIILNNECATYRGNLKYDMVDPKFCYIYVMYLRQGCGEECKPDGLAICAISLMDNHVAVFADRCALEEANCRRESFHEYEPVDMKLCGLYLSMNMYPRRML